MHTIGNRFAAISGIVALLADIVATLTVVGGFSGIFSPHTQEVSQPVAWLMFTLLLYSWVGLSWAIVGNNVHRRSIRNFSRFVMVVFFVISAVGILLLLFSIPVNIILVRTILEPYYLEIGDYVLYLFVGSWLFNLVVIGILVPLINPDMLDDFPFG
jgi:hypothetical protein